MSNKIDYPYLRAWNHLLASPTNWNLDLAREEKAPDTAIYRDIDGVWHTVESIKSEHTRNDIEAHVARLKAGV